MNQIISQWFTQNQKALELGNYSKVSLEIIIGQRTGNPVKLRSLLQSEFDLTASPDRSTKLTEEPS